MNTSQIVYYKVENKIWHDLKVPFERGFQPNRIFANVILGMRDFVDGAINSSIKMPVEQFLNEYDYNS